MLSFLLWLPILGATIISFYPGKIEAHRLRQFTFLFALIVLGWALFLLTRFDLSQAGFQFQQYLTWIKPIGLSYSLGVDGLSLPLVALNSLLTIIALYSLGEEVDRPDYTMP